MRLNRLPGVASNPEPAGGRRAGAGVVRVLSVTAVAVAACALSALPAMASSAAPAAPLVATTTLITYPALDAPVTEPAGTEVTLTATVTAADGSTPTGTVSFAPWNLAGPYAGYQVCSATLVDGTGSCQVDPPVGTWGFMQFEATYSGDATHAASNSGEGDNKLITPDPTTTSVTGPAAAAPGSVTLNASIVPDTYGGAGYNILLGESETGGDTVAFTVNGATECAAAPMTWNGTVNVAACTTTLAAGTYSVVAAYSGDEYTTKSTSEPFTLVVKAPSTPKHSSKTTATASPKTAKTRQDVKFSATVTSSGKAPTGTVTFWFGTRKLCTANVSDGKASCSAKFYHASKKTVTAKYSGDSTHDASSGTATVTIKRR
jgi:large repetitive protein